MKIDPEIDIGRSMRHAMSAHGKGALSQLSEICRLRFGRGKLDPKEYYYYRLYDDEAYSYEEKQRFLGRACWNRIYHQCNAKNWWAIAHDKLAFYALLRGQALPLPENRALFHPFRRCGDLPALASTSELAEHLRTRMVYPAFAKPVTGIRSVGVASLQCVDAAADALVLQNGQTIAIDDYVREVEAYRSDGYLFQEMLRPHEEIAKLCGNRLTTLRLVVGIEGNGPVLMHALWKVPVGDNPADNFWRPGNLLAALDPENGEVRRVISGVGPDQADVENHPDSAERLLGATLPDWRAALDVCLNAAAMFADLRLQAWDVALTDRGPVLIEVNIGGDFNLPQLALGAGLMDQKFTDFLARTHQWHTAGKEAA
ncbi:MAG: sugar-transfer associated ATP-grasp domain-containing protein [Geminicoccaceae bacterium]